MPIVLERQTLIPHLIKVTSPTTEVTVQELTNTIKHWEADLLNLDMAKIIDTVGKANLGGGFTTAITLTLSADWQIQFWDGVGVGIVSGGNVIGGYGDKPIKPTGGNDTIKLLQTVGGVIVAVGSGVTEQDKLDIADKILDEALSEHLIEGSIGDMIKKGATTDFTVAEIADSIWKENITPHSDFNAAEEVLAAIYEKVKDAQFSSEEIKPKAKFKV